MNHKSQSRSISWFQEQYKIARLTLRPPFQRKPVWTDKQKSALIESILINVPIPEVYIQVHQAEDGTEKFDVVDGQQRLRTILQFVGLERKEDQEGDEDSNDFALEALPATSPHKDKTFAKVTGDARREFYQYEVCVRLLYTDDIKIIEDVFKRLNKFLLPLKPQELRNATFHGPFAQLSEQLADDEYWAVNRIVSPAAIRRMADIEMMSDLLIGLLHGPQGGSAKIIDQYYEQYEQYEDEFPGQAKVKRVFERTQAAIDALFPEITDTRWGNRADYYSLFVAIGEQLKTKRLPGSSRPALRKKLVRFADEVNDRLEKPTTKTSDEARDYARAIEKGSNDKARRMDRHVVLTTIIESAFSARQGG